jgi:rhomboid family GlyGly-CTERM serine protease
MKTNISKIQQISKYPYISILMGGIASFIFFTANLNNYLQYERISIENGQIWRFLTGHFTHWNLDHFTWCIIVLIASGIPCEQFCRKGYIFNLVISSLLIPVFIWHLNPEMIIYRGSSGLSSSIFLFGAMWLILDCFKNNDWKILGLSVLAILLFCGKISFEYINNTTLFVQSQELFVPAPLAHFTGGLIGIITSIIFWRSNNS